MTRIKIAIDSIEPIVYTVKSGTLELITGSNNIQALIHRSSDDGFLDWDDYTFKSSALTTQWQSMTEVNSGTLPGDYRCFVTMSAITNKESHDIYTCRIRESGTSDAMNLPVSIEFEEDAALVDEIVSGTWNAQSSTFDQVDSMGYLQNLNGEILSASLSLSSSVSSMDDIVSGVWNADNAAFDQAGSMGYLQGLNTQILSASLSLSSSVVDVDVIVSGVWNAVGSTFNVADTMGYFQNLSTQILSASLSVSGAALDADTVISGVWNARSATFDDANTMGFSLNFVQDFTAGRWLITGSQHIFYREDNTTEIARFNLLDINGDPAVAGVDTPFERVRTGTIV